jgi:L-amino acid N-acyltransferase YncA
MRYADPRGCELASGRVTSDGMADIIIREATEADWPGIWELFRGVAASGDVFAYDEHTPEEVARKLWFDPPATCFVAEIDGRLAGTYYVRPNHPGRGSHVANGGYMVSPDFRGRGLASVMCGHSIEAARRLGFAAMQFNFVVSTNTAAVRTWEKHGFAVVGRLPKAFRHVTLGFVDALVMFRDLEGKEE